METRFQEPVFVRFDVILCGIIFKESLKTGRELNINVGDPWAIVQLTCKIQDNTKNTHTRLWKNLEKGVVIQLTSHTWWGRAAPTPRLCPLPPFGSWSSSICTHIVGANRLHTLVLKNVVAATCVGCIIRFEVDTMFFGRSAWTQSFETRFVIHLSSHCGVNAAAAAARNKYLMGPLF